MSEIVEKLEETQRYSLCDFCNWKDETHDEHGADYYCQKRIGIYSEQMEFVYKCGYFENITKAREAKG